MLLRAAARVMRAVTMLPGRFPSRTAALQRQAGMLLYKCALRYFFKDAQASRALTLSATPDAASYHAAHA